MLTAGECEYSVFGLSFLADRAWSVASLVEGEEEWSFESPRFISGCWDV